MEAMDDPAFIQSLFDPHSNYSCYFCIGDPRKGPVERIGVVPPMLIAHSLVLRRALDIYKSEVKEKWDITVSDITPKIFKNVLRYAYGYNVIKHQSLPHSVELLALADRWVMKNLSNDVANHIASIITPVNVCLAMREPICLRVKRVEEEISRMVKQNATRVLTSPYLHLICPASMRYIVLLKSLRASDVDVWRAVMRWARIKVLKLNLMSSVSSLDKYLYPKLLVPCQKYLKLCSLNMIDLVEEVLANHPNKQQNLEGISKCHFIALNPPSSLYVCTDSKNAHHLKHEEFQVEILYTCDAWMDAVYMLKSTIVIKNASESPMELYSIVCSSKQKSNYDFMEDEELADSTTPNLHPHSEFNYNASGVVKVILDELNVGESVIHQVNFDTNVAYDNDFQIQLSTKDESVKILPNDMYLIDLIFSKPHPLWYVNDPRGNQSSELTVVCGPINVDNRYFGSHIKYIVYRKYLQDE